MGNSDFSNSSDCITCGVGTYSTVDTGTCTKGGTADVEVTNISECDDGGTDFVRSCITCAAGNVAEVGAGNGVVQIGATSCTVCPIGTYNTASSDDCIACVAGKYIDVTGSNAASDCIDCAAGTESAAGSDSVSYTHLTLPTTPYV